MWLGCPLCRPLFAEDPIPSVRKIPSRSPSDQANVGYRL